MIALHRLASAARIAGATVIPTALLVIGWSAAANAATFELAKGNDGTIVEGVKVEGDIVPGDATKLLNFYKTYGTVISPIYLRSRGGNVEEAMKMGAIIRRLRLETDVPVLLDSSNKPIDRIKVDHQENMICGSACVLIYAGGARRFGNYLAMHRPFLPREEARQLNDVEYEAAQKEIVPIVKAYLADMEFDQYWIDRMFSANSQEVYVPTLDEAESKVHHLMGVVPSLEEVVLSKCNEDADWDKKLSKFMNSGAAHSADADAKLKQLMQDHNVFTHCQEAVLSDMQSAAFDRENDALLYDKCKQYPPLTPSETAVLQALARKGRNVTPDEENLRRQLVSKAAPYNTCKSRADTDLSLTTLNNWSRAFEASKRAAQSQSTDDFDAKGLSAEAMAKKGKEFYDAKNYDAASRWFKKAADLGNTEAMLWMSSIYRNGRGVPKNEAESLRWEKLSAERGSTVAMRLLGYDYEQGEIVPQDYAEAMRWYKKSAALGDPDAMQSIGLLYDQGHGVPQDYAEAMRWYKKSADLGNTFAMYCIGILYEFGNGVPKDEAQARVWMKKAAAMGEFGATQWLIDHP